MKETKGERIVKLLSKALKGSCGDLGGKDPYVDGNKITLYNQLGSETYRFNDDGSVDNLTDWSDIIDNESAWDDYGFESEDEAREYFESISHFDSIKDLFYSGLSWFMDIPNKLLSDINVILKESLTEADDDIMSDDDLDAEEQRERDEMEARFKARRDKVAQQRAERDAKIARDNELKEKAKGLLDEIGEDWQFEHLFDILVPRKGKCDTLAGELVRAVNKIEYRWFNDGDRFFEDYGIETCGPAYKFIVTHINESGYWEDVINQLFEEAAMNNYDNDAYDVFIERLKAAIIDYIKEHTETLAQETTDMIDINWKDVEEELEENGWIPTYEYDADIPDELRAHLDKGNISERDLRWEVESWIENVGCYNADVEVSDYVYIEGLNKRAHDELDGNLYDWLENYASELTKEHGDPYEEDEEETEEEGEE